MQKVIQLCLRFKSRSCQNCVTTSPEILKTVHKSHIENKQADVNIDKKDWENQKYRDWNRLKQRDRKSKRKHSTKLCSSYNWDNNQACELEIEEERTKTRAINQSNNNKRNWVFYQGEPNTEKIDLF